MAPVTKTHRQLLEKMDHATVTSNVQQNETINSEFLGACTKFLRFELDSAQQGNFNRNNTPRKVDIIPRERIVPRIKQQDYLVYTVREGSYLTTKTVLAMSHN
jgi:hypothetical protein